jgi:two-component system chemotaxis sensor kinase CheA
MDEQVFRALLEEFYLECKERLAHIEDALVAAGPASAAERAALLVDARRELHTLKGNSGMMGLVELQQVAHRIEDRIAEWRPETLGGGELREALGDLDRFARLLERERERGQGEGGAQPSGAEPSGETGREVQESVRVSFAALDALVDQLSEMVIFRNRLAETLAQGMAALPKGERLQSLWREVEEAHETLDRTLEDLQNGIMRLRLVPLGTLFGQLKRIVFDESAEHGKQVELATTGGETPLDKALLEVASEAMGHLVRNAVVHGLELPEARQAAGKPATGMVVIAAATLAEEVVIDISDDGAGIDRGALLAAARRRGYDVQEGIDLQGLLSLPGLSTREQADRSAGRGMGMTAVVESVRRRGGQVEVHSASGVGTRFRLRLPLTVAIVRALLVQADRELYALPLTAVQEAVQLQPDARHVMNGAGVMRWRGALMPLLDVGVAFGTAEVARGGGHVVVIEAEGKRRGLVVDGIAGIRDVVVKPLDEVTGEAQGLAGCTILGDGRVVLILDPTGLVSLSPVLEGTA